MRRKTRESIRPRQLSERVDIAADPAEVFAHWMRFEHFPHIMQSVRRTKRISDRRVLWDVVIAGHQLVWEAHIVEIVPGRCIRWESRWGTRMHGEVRFERLDRNGTRVTAEIDYQPDGLIERIGARLGWVDACVGRELAMFRDHVQALRRVHPIAGRNARDREERRADERRSAVHRMRVGRSPTADPVQRWRADSSAPARGAERRAPDGPSR